MLRVIETHTKDGSVIVEKIGTPEEITAADSFWMKRFMAGHQSPEMAAARECCLRISEKILNGEKVSEAETMEHAKAAKLLGGGTGGCT